MKTRVWQIFKIGSIALFSLGMLSACQDLKRPTQHGYVEATPIEQSVEVGSSKDEVLRQLGSPSTVSAFPPETWYYITRQRETVAFLEPELKGQKVMRIEFDNAGMVTAVEMADESKSRDVEYVERETPTEGRTVGVLEQLIGNLGKFNTPRDATTNRQ